MSDREKAYIAILNIESSLFEDEYYGLEEEIEIIKNYLKEGEG